MPDIIFVSKVDLWLALLLWGLSLFTVSVPLWQWKRDAHKSLIQTILMTVILIPFAALMLIPFFGTKYILTNDQLQVDSGFSVQKIELTDITYIMPTQSMSSAPALSLDRIEILYKDEEILISPKDKSRFYCEIRARNPRIVIDTAGE
ncbi:MULTISPECIES: PH domain-containing protein [unclassified Psychrobacter]|uniref:PH domain-containing protein n=1 Tax=unclassified Psychrobacter TaxID=196806 RepID=UPI0025B29FF4|nr:MULTISPECIES: PH domain-containing protein [unclassified Psychrobacter]MDN3452853.1 PH domain-containing protein [Psychrobacter sp. APC 3350]MDN3502552.1 PH domain-containing protein [Psychrobacter sp. 5A.1]